MLLALALRRLPLEHLLTFGLVVLIGVPLCVTIAFVIGKLPLASWIL